VLFVYEDFRHGFYGEVSGIIHAPNSGELPKSNFNDCFCVMMASFKKSSPRSIWLFSTIRCI